MNNLKYRDEINKLIKRNYESSVVLLIKRNYESSAVLIKVSKRYPNLQPTQLLELEKAYYQGTTHGVKVGERETL